MVGHESSPTGPCSRRSARSASAASNLGSTTRCWPQETRPNAEQMNGALLVTGGPRHELHARSGPHAVVRAVHRVRTRPAGPATISLGRPVLPPGTSGAFPRRGDPGRALRRVAKSGDPARNPAGHARPGSQLRPVFRADDQGGSSELDDRRAPARRSGSRWREPSAGVAPSFHAANAAVKNSAPLGSAIVTKVTLGLPRATRRARASRFRAGFELAAG